MPVVLLIPSLWRVLNGNLTLDPHQHGPAARDRMGWSPKCCPSLCPHIPSPALGTLEALPCLMSMAWTLPGVSLSPSPSMKDAGSPAGCQPRGSPRDPITWPWPWRDRGQEGAVPSRLQLRLLLASRGSAAETRGMQQRGQSWVIHTWDETGVKSASR